MTVNIEKTHYSTTEAAKLLVVSRIAVFKWIKAGKIKAKKVGRNFVIARSAIERYLPNGELTEKEKKLIGVAVHRAAKEYAEAFELLGKE
ncbi:MAG: excisionase family DNA-binding protein [Patescibacteria group bacterium]